MTKASEVELTHIQSRILQILPALRHAIALTLLGTKTSNWTAMTLLYSNVKICIPVCAITFLAI